MLNTLSTGGQTQRILFPLFQFQPYCWYAFWLQLKKTCKNLCLCLTSCIYIIWLSCLVSLVCIWIHIWGFLLHCCVLRWWPYVMINMVIINDVYFSFLLCISIPKLPISISSECLFKVQPVGSLIFLHFLSVGI